MVPMVSLLLIPVDRGVGVAILEFQLRLCPVTDKILPPNRKEERKREEGREKRREMRKAKRPKINGLRQDLGFT